MRKGLIVIGYQGIGKSSCAGKNGCIDLESGNFWIGAKRSDDWHIPYCQIAMHLANQGYTVFTSSHAVVREHLATMPKLENVGAVVIFCPTSNMREDWIQRLRDRYNTTGLMKDYKALKNAEDKYDENIAELCHSYLPVYQPAALDYDLMNYVMKMRSDWCGGRDSVRPSEARWIFDRPHHYRCSACNAMWGDSAVTMVHCPGCGARMDPRFEILGNDGKLKTFNTDTGKFEVTEDEDPETGK